MSKDTLLVVKMLGAILLASVIGVSLVYADRPPPYITVEEGVSITEREAAWALREAMRITEASRPAVVQYVRQRPITISLNQRLPIGVLAGVRIEDDSISMQLATARVSSGVLTHEMVHIVLSSMGIPGGPYGDNHHEIMRENDWCYHACNGLQWRQN